MWKESPKTPHTQILCRFQFYKLPLKTNRVPNKKNFWRKKNYFAIKLFNLAKKVIRLLFKEKCKEKLTTKYSAKIAIKNKN
jgi:hypothetical protein